MKLFDRMENKSDSVFLDLYMFGSLSRALAPHHKDLTLQWHYLSPMAPIERSLRDKRPVIAARTLRAGLAFPPYLRDAGIASFASACML